MNNIKPFSPDSGEELKRKFRAALPTVPPVAAVIEEEDKQEPELLDPFERQDRFDFQAMGEARTAQRLRQFRIPRETKAVRASIERRVMARR
jgi:hypothetical protein